MKNIFVIILVVCSSVSSFSQDTSSNRRLSNLLESYYQIKEALVSGNSASASSAAAKFIGNLNGVSYTLISEGNVNTLLTDAGAISESTDLNKQRKSFINFSANMIEVAKALRLSFFPIHVQHCPMKNASWLSNEKTIRNPYYGNSMLACGQVVNTLE
jgi:hypothetical protein